MPRSLSVFSVIALPIIVPYFGLLSTHAYPAIALVTIISPLLTAPTTLHGTRPVMLVLLHDHLVMRCSLSVLD